MTHARPGRRGVPRLAFALAFACAAVAAAPAHAQWTRVAAVTSLDLYGVIARGDTVVAGGDSVVWISTNAGATWHASAPVATAPAYVEGLWVRNGRVWAGTSGQGVWTSDDLGASWQAHSEGLVGGIYDSQNTILAFAERADTLYAATGGAGVYARQLRPDGPWRPTGSQLVDYQSGSAEGIAAHGGRLLYVGGSNGTVFRNDGGAPWTEMFLDNQGVLPGLFVCAVAWTGHAWMVGTDHGFYVSADGTGEWTFVGGNLGSTFESRIASDGVRTIACVNRAGGAVLRWTRDDGRTWGAMETLPALPSDLALQGDRLWASRFDGLWYRDVSTLGVPAPEPRAHAFVLRGAHPLRGAEARFAVGLAAAARARVELFDVTGRRVRSLERDLPAGEHELAVDVRGLAPGVYHARCSDGTRAETLRLVRLDGAGD